MCSEQRLGWHGGHEAGPPLLSGCGRLSPKPAPLLEGDGGKGNVRKPGVSREGRGGAPREGDTWVSAT